MKTCLFIVILTLFSNIVLADEKKLRTSYYRQNMAPQLFFDENNTPTGGILFDITHAIADKLDLELEMLPIPRKRIEQTLVRNIIDMHCAANKSWYTLSTLQWSSVIYKNRDILINNQGITSLAELANYKQLKVGTSLGYIYPELISYINNNNILPVSSVSPEDSYKLYRKNKVAGFVIPEIEASPFIKEITDSVVILNDNDIRCVLAPSMKKSRVDSISDAIEQLKSSGDIDAILSKYMPEPKLAREDAKMLAD